MIFTYFKHLVFFAIGVGLLSFLFNLIMGFVNMILIFRLPSNPLLQAKIINGAIGITLGLIGASYLFSATHNLLKDQNIGIQIICHIINLVVIWQIIQFFNKLNLNSLSAYDEAKTSPAYWSRPKEVLNHASPVIVASSLILGSWVGLAFYLVSFLSPIWSYYLFDLAKLW